MIAKGIDPDEYMAEMMKGKAGGAVQQPDPSAGAGAGEGPESQVPG